MCRRITIKLVVSCGARSRATVERIAALEKHNALVWCAHYGGHSADNFRLDSYLSAYGSLVVDIYREHY